MPCTALLWPLATGVLWGVVGVLHGRVARGRTSVALFLAVGSLGSSLFAGLVIVDHRALVAHGLEPVWGLFVCAGSLAAAGMMAMNRGMRCGHHGGVWTVGQSALVIPFLAGVLVWDDAASPSQWAGLVTVIAGIWLIGIGKRSEAGPSTHGEGHWIGWALLALMLFGAQQTVMGIPSRWPAWRDVGRVRVPLFYLGMAVLCVPTAWRERAQRWPWREMLGLVAVGVPANLCLFRALDVFAAAGRGALVFPVAIGMTIGSFALYSVLVSREPCSWIRGVAIALTIAGVTLVAAFD